MPLFFYLNFLYRTNEHKYHMNKYSNWYNDIINRAKTRTLDGYKERHHIVPRSLGGDDSKENMVDLTAREHFICHWLLVKMHSGIARGKMINAIVMMKAAADHQDRYFNSRVYEKLREEYRQYISNMNKGRVQPLHEKIKQIEAMTGRKRKPFNQEWLERLAASNRGERNGMYGKRHSEATKERMSYAAKNRRKETPEEIERRISRIRGSKREKKHCEHCDQYVAVNGYSRFHGDKCKKKI